MAVTGSPTVPVASVNRWPGLGAHGRKPPRDIEIAEPLKLLCDTLPRTARDGTPQIVALDCRPDPDELARLADLAATDVRLGLPDLSTGEIAGFIGRLAGKLAAAE